MDHIFIDTIYAECKVDYKFIGREAQNIKLPNVFYAIFFYSPEAV